MQGTSLMLYLKVTDFSLMSPSSHEVSIELSMKACRLEAENPSKFCDSTLTKCAVICNACLLLEKLHQVPCTAGCVCLCVCVCAWKEKQLYTAINAFKKNQALCQETQRDCESHPLLRCFSMTTSKLSLLPHGCCHEQRCGQIGSLRTRECHPWHRC